MPMRWINLVVPMVAAVAVSCSATPEPSPRVDVTVLPPSTAPTTQAEVEQLRAENARLRAQIQGVVTENTVIRTHEAVVEAKAKTIESGKLEVGMTVPEANKAITGSANLYKDTCQLIDQSNGEWTYRIWTDAPVLNPGSGGTASTATNMRAERTAPVQKWLCTFDASTGKLKSFKRDLEK